MARITWNQVAAPDYSAAIKGTVAAGDMFGRALSGLGQTAFDIRQRQKEDISAQAMAEALKFTDASSFDQAMQNGLLGYDPTNFTADAMKYFQTRGTDLLNRDQTRLGMDETRQNMAQTALNMSLAQNRDDRAAVTHQNDQWRFGNEQTKYVRDEQNYQYGQEASDWITQQLQAGKTPVEIQAMIPGLGIKDGDRLNAYNTALAQAQTVYGNQRTYANDEATAAMQRWATEQAARDTANGTTLVDAQLYAQENLRNGSWNDQQVSTYLAAFKNTPQGLSVRDPSKSLAQNPDTIAATDARAIETGLQTVNNTLNLQNTGTEFIDSVTAVSSQLGSGGATPTRLAEIAKGLGANEEQSSQWVATLIEGVSKIKDDPEYKDMSDSAILAALIGSPYRRALIGWDGVGWPSDEIGIDFDDAKSLLKQYKDPNTRAGWEAARSRNAAVNAQVQSVNARLSDLKAKYDAATTDEQRKVISDEIVDLRSKITDYLIDPVKNGQKVGKTAYEGRVQAQAADAALLAQANEYYANNAGNSPIAQTADAAQSPSGTNSGNATANYQAAMDAATKLDLDPSATSMEKQAAAVELAQARKQYEQETKATSNLVDNAVRGSLAGALRNNVTDMTDQVVPTTPLTRLVQQESELVAELEKAKASGRKFDVQVLQTELNRTRKQIKKLQAQ